MYIYSPDQWILLFFAYAFAGYVWEVLYVSACQHKIVNRGFLFGPILPIYGFGAIVILHATIPVAKSMPLVFICGMVSATALEYATGAAMERIFGVRYWDYSGDKGNVNGYICPRASFAWGVGSVLLIRFVHPWFDDLIGLVPGLALNLVTHIMAIIFAADTALSVREAFDVKAMLRDLEEDSLVLQRAAERAEMLRSLADDARERMEERREAVRTSIDAHIAFHDLNQNGIPDELEELEASIRERLAAINAKRPRPYKAMKRILKNNPTATASKIKSAVERIRQQSED